MKQQYVVVLILVMIAGALFSAGCTSRSTHTETCNSKSWTDADGEQQYMKQCEIQRREWSPGAPPPPDVDGTQQV